MAAAMKVDGVLTTLDNECTTGTTRPRYLANSSSHRSKLIRHDLISEGDEGQDILTDLGQTRVESWLQESNRSVEDFNNLIEPKLEDRYFLYEPYCTALYLMGGQAEPLAVVRAVENLIKNSPAFVGTRQSVENGKLSDTYFAAFKKLGINTGPVKGLITLTEKRQFIALTWLKNCSTSVKDLKKSLPRKR
jgi:hypothetical protein